MALRDREDGERSTSIVAVQLVWRLDLRRQARAVAEWVVILEMLGEEDIDDKPPRCSQSVHERPNCYISALGLMLADVRRVDPISTRMARRSIGDYFESLITFSRAREACRSEKVAPDIRCGLCGHAMHPSEV